MCLFNGDARSVATIGGENKSSGPFPFKTFVGADLGEKITVADVGRRWRQFMKTMVQ